MTVYDIPLPRSSAKQLDSVAVQIKSDLYWFYEAIARRERGTTASVINDILRKNMEGHG